MRSTACCKSAKVTRLIGALCLVMSSAFVIGCATGAKQTDALLQRAIQQPGQPMSAHVDGVPFVAQSENYCGPAALSMAMKWAGRNVELADLGAQMYTPGKKGTLQTDILTASRRNGMLAIPIYGIEALTTEIAAGHPVIVLQNLALSWYPKWHYAVAHGYDLKDVTVRLHSGRNANEQINLRRFEHTWALANYWGVVVLPPGRLSASASDLKHAEAAAVLEQIGKNQEAEKVYFAMLDRWPQSLGALVGLGNTRYSAGDFVGATKYLKRASRAHPHSPVVWHNLATAQLSAGFIQQAKLSAKQALSLAQDEATQSSYQESLAPLLSL